MFDWLKRLTSSEPSDPERKTSRGLTSFIWGIIGLLILVMVGIYFYFVYKRGYLFVPFYDPKARVGLPYNVATTYNLPVIPLRK